VNQQEECLFQKKSEDELIEVWQNNHHRWLNINGIEQSRLNIEQPEQLVSPLDYAFLSCFLFIHTPNNVLLGGLGGGVLAQYLHNKQPGMNGCAVEINPLIVQLAKDYFNFPEKKWSIIIDDIQHVIKNKSSLNYDLILLDIGDKDLTPEWLISEKVLLQLKHQLSTHGVLAINLLVSDAESFRKKLAGIRKVFNRQTLCIGVPKHNNIVVFAFNKHPFYSTPDQLQSRVKELTEYWQVDYATLLEQMQKENPKGSGVL